MHELQPKTRSECPKVGYLIIFRQVIKFFLSPYTRHVVSTIIPLQANMYPVENPPKKKC